jgi:K+-transporting ATPase KdpF subunit
MGVDAWVGTVAAVALMVYLVYTLLRPEKF